MTKLISIFGLLPLLLMVGLQAQVVRAPVLDPELRRLLVSPFEAERESGVEVLRLIIRQEPGALEAWLEEPSPVLRAGILRAAGGAAESLAELATLFPRVAVLDDADLRRSVNVDLLVAGYRLWRGEAALFGSQAELDPALVGAARVFVARKLDELAASGTLMTEHRALAAFSFLGPIGQASLRHQALHPHLGIAARMLAISALSRTDERSFFVNARGEPSAEMRKLLDSQFDNLKLGALYGLAFRGLRERSMLREVARYAREDAFNEYTIEAALYTLHCRGRAGIAEIGPDVDLCLKEFLDSLYSERARFHAAQLLAARGIGDSWETALEMVRAGPSFSSYWVLAAVLNGLEQLPEDQKEAVEQRALELALRADSPPQSRALALWYLRKEQRAIPEGVAGEALRSALLESAAKVATLDVDPDSYALRSSLEILAFLGDRAVIPIIVKSLDHESEAVRMAAAMAAGQGGFVELGDDLAVLLDRPFEYAAFGAATGLDMLGDDRGLRWFADYLASGNAVLMPAALERLRKGRGKTLVQDLPTAPSGWRRLGALWRQELETSATGR